MEPKKSIRDIASKSSNLISDMVSEKPIIKKTRKIAEIVETPTPVIEDTYYEEAAPIQPVAKKIKNIRKINFRKIRNLLSEIKPIYLIGLVLIVVLLGVLVFMPSRAAKDPVEQAKAEAEVVKKQLSKHIILPENEQIDIRKITSKMEDPFFQNAEIGDYLVIFYKNRIAYIYSPDKDIIVNAGVVFIDPKTATTTSSTSKSQ